MIPTSPWHKFRLSKEYLIKRLEKYLERGYIHRSEFPIKQIVKLKELGLIKYNERKPHYDIKMDVYNKFKGELENDKTRVQ